MAHKTGIIGLGIMGRRMLEHMHRHAEFAPTALWDPNADACAQAAADAGAGGDDILQKIAH